MKQHPYKDQMLNLPFSEDLEERTIAMLKASSAEIAKEDIPMKNTPKSNDTHATTKASQRPFWTTRKFLAASGGVLAAAACFLLVILPILSSPVALEVQGDDELPVDINVVYAKQSTGTTDTPSLSESEPAEANTSTTAKAPAMGSQAGEAIDWTNWSFDTTDDAVGMGEATVIAPAPGSASTSAIAPAADSESSEPMDWASFGYVSAAGNTAAGTGVLWQQAPAFDTEEYNFIAENRFLSTLTSPLSTFAADVDTASYSKLRSAILSGKSVPADSVRIEEMLNYFSYEYAGPKEGEPFGVTTEIADCPWNPDTKLLLIGLQAAKIPEGSIPAQNLVFLIDVSGSMDEPNKLPLVQRSFLLLLEELRPTDTVSIVTYASGDRVVLDGVRASDKTKIMEAINGLMAGGGTSGAAGIQTAYELAGKHFIDGGNNRVLLATDGDFNIGVSGEGPLTRLIEEKRQSGISLSVLGFGYGNYKDNKLEALADHGNGNYAYIDTIYEARKALVEDMGGTFLTVAKDVKLQVDFNPAKVKGYRLIGYENRTMAAEDFANDQKDGGEVGSGHRVTVLYELVPIDSPMPIDTAETKYQSEAVNENSEWLTLNLRAKAPDGDTSALYQYPVDESAFRESMSDNMRFASAVAETGMLLRDSEFKANASYEGVLQRLRSTASVSGDVYKEEFQYMVTLLGREAE